MNFNISSIENTQYYIKFNDLKKYGMNIFFCKKSFGDAKKLSKDEMLNKLNVKDKVIISSYQTHSSNIQIIDDINIEYFEDTDGFISKRDDIIMMTKYADCLPIFFLDKNQKIFGVVHSGWLGTVNQIIIKALDLLKKNFNTKNEDIVIVFGIGISAKNYEVKEDFVNKFKNFDEDLKKISFIRKGNRIFFDNQLFNALILKKYGIKEENIFCNNLCTFDNEDFFSYRREKKGDGRNASFIFKD